MLLSADQLEQVLKSHFPVDATSWEHATDELRDIARWARETLGYPVEAAIDFSTFATPSEWNTRAIETIISYYREMTEPLRQQLIDQIESHFPGLLPKVQ